MHTQVNSISSWLLTSTLVVGLLMTNAVRAGDAANPTISPTGQAVADVVQKYGNVPGGVVLEGQGADFGKFAAVNYDAAKNQFVLDSGLTYVCPVPKAQMRDILNAIHADERIGISLSGPDDAQRIHTYGRIAKDSGVVRALQKCDNLLGDIALALEAGLKHTKVEAGYKPMAPRDKARHYAAFFSFGDYRFQKNSNVISLRSSTLDVTLVPLKPGTAQSGANTPDYDALKKYGIPAEYKANAQHILSNEAAYRRRKVVSDVALCGEAAAFARAVKANKISLRELAKQLK